MQITTIAKEIHEVAKQKGFWDKERNIGELLMLVVTELSEALEAHRKGKTANLEEYSKCNETYISVDKEAFEHYIKDSFEDEIADSVIRLLDLSAGLGIDLEAHILLKLEYNKTRERLHGKEY